MSHTELLQDVIPFESASELREAHTRLLNELDTRLEPDYSTKGEAAALAHLESHVREFVERGAATGIYLEEVKERTDCQVLVNYWVSTMAQARIHMGGFRLAQFAWELLPDLKDKHCPYMGLEAFRDSAFFFGRETDIKALLDQVHDAPLVVVIGASGSGKSSLVIGGVLPALSAGEELRIVPPFVPGKAILDHLADAILQGYGDNRAARAAEVAALRANPQHLCTIVGTDAPRTLITIDQFEEVFTLSGSADREVLIANLAQLLHDERGHRVILTVREEFKSRMVELSELSSYLDKAWYSMRPMGYDELRAAVEKPAALVNLQFQSGIIDDLVKKVLGQPAALPLLQFTLRTLWENRDRNRITWEVYRRVGDPLNALKTSADRFYDSLAPQTQDEVRRLLLELVRVDELLEAYRQPVSKSTLLQAGKANTEEALRLLSENDYVRITVGEDDALVEIKHESLVRNWPRLVGWVDEKRHQRRQRLALTQAAQQWKDKEKPEEGLLTGWQLEAAVAQPDLSSLENEFVQASSEALDRIRRERETILRKNAKRFRNLWIATIVFAGIAIYKSYDVLQQRDQAIVQERQDREKISKAKEEAAQSRERLLQVMKLQPLNYVDDQLDLALLLGIEATRAAGEQPEVRRSLLSALTSNLELKQLLPGHKGPVRTVALSPDAKILASGSYDNTVILWNVASGLQLHPPLGGHDKAVFRVAFSPTGKILASASLDGTVRLWNAETGKPIGMPLEHYGSKVYSVAFRKDGKLLASAGEGGIVRLWNVEDQQPVASLEHNPPAAGERRSVYNVAFSPDGALLASGGKDGRIQFWDVERRQQDGRPIETNREVFSMAFSNDGKTIASGNQEGRVDLWDVPGRTFVRGLIDHSRGVYGLAFSPTGEWFATVSRDGKALVYNAEDVLDKKATPKKVPPLQRLKGHFGEFLSVDLSSDGTIVTGAESGMVVLWNLKGFHRFGEQISPPKDTGNTTERLHNQVVFGPKKDTLISSSEDRLQFWDLGKITDTSKAEAKATNTQIVQVALAPDRKMLAIVGSDYGVNLWDAVERRPIKTLIEPGKDVILSVAFIGGSNILAIRLVDKIRRLSLPDAVWFPDILTGKTSLLPLVSSSDGKLLAFADQEKTMIMDLDSGKSVALEQSDFDLDHKVYSLAFSPDGKTLVSGGERNVEFWDSHTGESRLRRGSHPGGVMSVEISPDGNMLASGGYDGTLLLWDLETRQPLSQPIQAHSTKGISSIAFSRDGQQLASTGVDGSLILWPANLQAWLSRACQVAGRNFTEDEWKQFFGDQQPFRISCPAARAKEADALALNGDAAKATQFFEEALHSALEMKDPDVNNDVCWYGSVNRFEKLVKPACERAVELAPESTRPFYQDSRGLARALTGDTLGAIDDFTTAVQYIKGLPNQGGYSPEFLQRREQWIAALKQGHNPFDNTLLRALRIDY